MWNYVDSNKIIGTYMKIEAYKNHVQKLKGIKSKLKVQSPWKSPFSLSRFKNRYQKNLQTQVNKENQNLITRMIRIDASPLTYNVNIIPPTIPTNPQTFSQAKKRQRHINQCQLDKENMKILRKIQNATSDYGKSVWKDNWENQIKYRRNITKNQTIPDFSVLAKQYATQSRVITRPSTALR